MWLLEIVHKKDEAFFPSRVRTPTGTTDAGTGVTALEEQAGEGEGSLQPFSLLLKSAYLQVCLR